MSILQRTGEKEREIAQSETYENGKKGEKGTVLVKRQRISTRDVEACALKLVINLGTD